MAVHLRCPIQVLTSTYGLPIPKYPNTRNCIFSSSPPNTQRLIFRKAIAMNTNSEPKSKRPTCPNCSKPLSVCLCSRIKTPNLRNQVNITILQHSLETKHPLNSTKIAKLGLNNLSVVTVFDVNFEARFDIRILEPGCDCPPPVCGNASVNSTVRGPKISFSIEKYGKFSSISPKLEEIMNSSVSQEAMARGFIVKKCRKEGGSMEFEEFEIAIPPGTAVLFPAEDSVGVEGLDFSVKSLIVLDGTWSKATRIYNENPWLRLLPCVRLDVNKASLYSEVRLQPKPGCLSTLESIVYALEAIGEEESVLQGLENLLEVFASMVEDQRRCKDERLSTTS